MTQNLNALLETAKIYDAQLPGLVLPAGHPGSRPLSAWIDHTILKADATPDQVQKVCDEALEHQFASVCINPVYVPLASRMLAGSSVLVCTVVGFPLGATLTAAKAAETRLAIEEGAQEIDMVIPVGLLKGSEYAAVYEDILQVVEAAHASGAQVKVILEMVLLTRYEKIAGCLLSQGARADFVKTSTGFSTGGATLEDVRLMRSVIGPQMGLKAAGGVRTLADARAMLMAGATRLGTSAGVKLMQEAAQEMEAG
jgi:deoxyribose-phosphate aldolase